MVSMSTSLSAPIPIFISASNFPPSICPLGRIEGTGSTMMTSALFIIWQMLPEWMMKADGHIDDRQKLF